MHILIVEDNPLNRAVAVRLLEYLGHQADIAANGVEALAKVIASSYDVVLMDLDMPVMDGLTAAREIRERLPDAGQLPIVALTAHVLDEDRQVCLDAGMNGFLQKPFRVEELTRVLDEVAAAIG